MPGDIIQFVDTISATPTVLYNFNNEAPSGVAQLSAPPPQLIRVTNQSQSQDGATEAGSVYGDRLIDIDQDLFETTQDAWASSWQTLARLLSDPRGQWLKYQPVGASQPVFFRTRRADVTTINDLIAAAARRELHLTIPAQPFAYGLEVAASVTITNNPTAAGPMSYVLPAVHGDVITPLRVKISSTVSPSPARLCVASVSHPTQPPAPIYGDFVTAYGFPATGWTHSSEVNAAYIGAAAAKAVKANPGLVNNFVAAVAPAGGAVVPMGDYRLFLRASVPVGWRLTTEGNTGFTPEGSHLSTNAALAWRDMGVVPVPQIAGQDSAWPDTEGTGWNGVLPVTVYAPLESSVGTVVVDAWILVPAGLRNSRDSSVALIATSDPVQPNIPMGSGQELWLDGFTSEVVSKSTGAAKERYALGIVTTAFLKAVPGASNVLHCFGLAEATTVTFTVSYSYYPRYLFVRPAAS